MNTMTEQEKAISQLCIALQGYFNEMREVYGILECSYYMRCIERCVEQIHRMVNPDFNDICETVEAFEQEGDDESGN